MTNPRLREGVDCRQLDAELVVFDAASGRTFRLSETAALILLFCDGEHSPEEILSELRGLVRGGDAQTVAGDVERTLAELRAQGLIV
jgi:PqqD family protein of HPr-rel-A system